MGELLYLLVLYFYEMFAEADPSIREQYLAQFEEQFFMFCDKELEKVNTFFAGIVTLSFYCVIMQL